MNFFLILIIVLSVLFGAGSTIFGSSVIHEIYGIICFLIAVVALIGNTIVNQLADIKKLLGAKEAPSTRKILAEEPSKAGING